MRGISRRVFIKGLVGSGAVAAGTGIYGRFWESKNPRVVTRSISLNRGDRPIRIVQLTDLHASGLIPLSYIEEVVKTTLALRPDVVCLTGDFVTRVQEIPDGYPDVLRLLTDAVPAFATLGNHDGGWWTALHGGVRTSIGIRNVLKAANLPCLHNQSATVSTRGRDVELVGLGDIWNGECHPAIAFGPLKQSPHRSTRLVLSHNPDTKDVLSGFDWDVLLSGHTHGGQVGIPILARRFAPVRDKRYIDGLYPWNNRWLHVSRGVGCLFGTRIGCRPEISVLELV